MKKIIYIFSAALLCLVSCTREMNPVQSSQRTTTVAPKEGDMALATFYVSVSETSLYATQTRAWDDPLGEQPKGIANGALFVAVFGAGSNGLGGQLQHFVKATLMKDPTTPGPGIGIDPPITHDLTDEDDPTKTYRYAYQVLLPVSESPLVLDFFAGAYDKNGNLFNLDNPLPVAYEKDVMPLLLSLNGNAAYWQRVEIPAVRPKQDADGNYVMAQILDEDGEVISQEAEEYEAQEITELKDIRLVRNFAKVTFTNLESADFTVNRFHLVDTPVSGTVAPFSGSAGYANAYTTTQDAATIMHSYNGYILSTELSTGFDGSNWLNPGEYDYMYERTIPDLNKPYGESGAILEVKWNDSNDVDAALRGQTRYYKVSFVDNSGAVPILRNIVYNFQLSDIAADTHPTTPEAAYAGPFLGDISANIATSMLDEITNNRSLIKVGGGMSHTAIGSNKEFDVEFWFYPDVQNHPDDVVVNHNATFQGQTVTIQVVLEEVAGHSPAIKEFTNTTASNASVGTVHVKMNDSAVGMVKKSKLKILGQWGTQRALYREIEFTVMEKQNLVDGATECSVTALGSDAVDQDVTVTIQLPDDLPRDIFPLQIMIEPQNNGLRSVPHTEGGVTESALPVKHGESAFDATKRNYYFVKTITFDEYATLNGSTYDYTNAFPCYFKTRLTTDNATAIKINDVKKEYFIESTVNLQ